MNDTTGEEIDESLIETIKRKRDVLLSVADIACNAIDETADYEERGKIDDALDKVDDALVRISRDLCCEEEKEVEPAKPVAHRSCFDALAEDLGLRLHFFRAGNFSKYIGVRKPAGGWQEHLFEAVDDHKGHVGFFRDGEPIAELSMYVQRTHVGKIVCHMLRDIIGENVRRYESKKRARAARRAAAGGLK